MSSTIADNATTFSNNSGLIANTTYNYLLVPFTWDGTNAATYNYLTGSAPTASATTNGGAPSIASTTAISSITENSASSGGSTFNGWRQLDHQQGCGLGRNNRPDHRQQCRFYQ